MKAWPTTVELCPFNGPEVLTLKTVYSSLQALYITGDHQEILVKRQPDGTVKIA